MWLLECEGEVLGGKKLWLKPGNKYVLGRVPSPQVNLPMPSQKSISRVHLIIEVGDVMEGDGIKLHTRSAVTVTDYKTKHGTRLDGNEIRNQAKELEGEEHFFHLGKYEPGFRLFWHPVVISVSLSSKERKDKKVMSPYQKKVEALDIKTIATYVLETTHIVATKRNTALGLQALINGRYIVTNSYLDAIVEAASVSGEEPGTKNREKTGEEVRSLLETDFGANWPNPEDYLPVYSNEPRDRESWRYRPNEQRKFLFEGYTFVFCERAQYDNFLGPITNAHGKLEKFDLEPGKTTAEDLVKFVKKAGQSLRAVMVRFRGKKDPEWENQLSTEAQELMGYRMIEQNEFLDIIVMLDKESLQVPLQDDSLPVKLPSAQEPSRSTFSSENPSFHLPSVPVIADSVEIAKLPAPPKLIQPPQSSARGRGRIRTRIKAFDPFAIDPSEFKPPPAQGPSGLTAQMTGLQSHTASVPEIVSETDPRSQAAWADEAVTLSSPKRGSMQSEPLDTSMEVEQRRPQIQRLNARLSSPQGFPIRSISRKRSITAEADRANEDFDVMDLLPGAQAVKRRKVEEREERIRRGETIGEPPPELTPTPAPGSALKASEKAKAEKSTLKGKGKKALKEAEKVKDPYVVRAREIKEREEEDARVAKEEELAAMDGLEVEKMRNLAIVEIMEVKPRADKPVQGEYGDEGARWDDKWNGRKNFKKFKRQGWGGGMRTMRGTVMVNLVEHKGKDFGIGDGYWLDKDEDTKSSVGRKSQALLVPDDSESDQGDTPFRSGSGQPTRSTTQTQSETQASSSRRSQAISTDTISRGKKRVAPTAQAGRPGGGKKHKAMFLKSESGSENESEDELKFRFKRK